MKNVTIQLSLIVLLSITGNQCLGQSDIISLDNSRADVYNMYAEYKTNSNHIKAFTIPLKGVCHALNLEDSKFDNLKKIVLRAYFGLDLQPKDTCLYIIQLSDTTMYGREPRKLNTQLQLIKYCPKFNIYKKDDNIKDVEDSIIYAAINNTIFSISADTIEANKKNNATPKEAVEAYIRKAYVSSGEIIWFDFPLKELKDLLHPFPLPNDTLRFYMGQLFDGQNHVYVRNLKSMKIYDLITPCPPLCDTDSRLFFY